MASCGQKAKPLTRVSSWAAAKAGSGREAAVGGGGADPAGDAFLAVAEAFDHAAGEVGGVQAGGDRHAGQVDEAGVVQQAQLLLHQFQQLSAHKKGIRDIFSPRLICELWLTTQQAWFTVPP
jgi:hypothetical protein